MSRFVIVVLANIACAIAALPVATADTAWEEYLKYPSPENAERIDVLRYSDGESDSQRAEDDVELLARQVLAGDEQAVRLAFRLRKQADGALGETLDITLGQLIRIDATLFLVALGDNIGDLHRLDSLVGNLGGAYVDRFQAKTYEVSRRIEALESVADPALAAVREACVHELREHLKHLEEPLKELEENAREE